MSYDIYLTDPASGRVLETDEPHNLKGGTYALGGTTEAWLNVTYNYARHFGGVGPSGIRSLYGKTGAESMPMLDYAISLLGDDEHDDYWKGTEGNAKRALRQLRTLAEMFPDGVWKGD